MWQLFCILSLAIASAAVQAQVQIPCDFQDTPRGYECRLPDVDLSIFDDFVIAGGQHLPGRNDANVVSFFSVNNNFPSFPTTHIARFVNLNQIKVSGSLITHLPSGAVANRPALQTLILSNNLIDVIDPLAFSGTTNIREFSLMFNRIRDVIPAAFNVLPNLQILDLSLNLIETVPANLFTNNPQINSLNLNSNRITFMNETFFNNILNLNTLLFNANLCYSGSFFDVQLPANRQNMFTRLQPCFQQGPIEFRCVFGFSFQGTEFNDYTCYLRELVATDMGRAIDLTGFHLQSRTNADVRYLWMDSSDVRFFVNQMFLDFINLRGVHITHSNLEAIQPGAFLNANNLRYIYIVANAVRRLEANTFQHAFGLETIHMWFNRLEYINENAFIGLTNLRELHLQGGNLVTFQPTTFVPLPNLQYFDASTNKIDILSGQWFANNTRISQLIFNFNEIYAINQNILEVGNLTTLGLLDNVCVDAIFHITDANRDQVRDELNPCFDQYPLRLQRFILELEGDLTITDVNGTVIGNL